MTLALYGLAACAFGVAPWFIWRLVDKTQAAMELEPAAVPVPVDAPETSDVALDRAA
ncbi:MAG: hypothetical protein AAGE18_15825 [Pseudomonadota bacterium]